MSVCELPSEKPSKSTPEEKVARAIENKLAEKKMSEKKASVIKPLPEPTTSLAAWIIGLLAILVILILLFVAMRNKK
jgi:hypothetical protein